MGNVISLYDQDQDTPETGSFWIEKNAASVNICQVLGPFPGLDLSIKLKVWRGDLDMTVIKLTSGGTNGYTAMLPIGTLYERYKPISRRRAMAEILAMPGT